MGSTSRICVAAVLLAALAGVAAWRPDRMTAGDRPVPGPYAREGALKLLGAVPIAREARQWNRVEWKVELSAAYDNPFDPAEVALDARITPPSGKAVEVPGFLFRWYERALNGGSESLAPAGEPEWRVRFTPRESGEHRITFRLKDRTGSTELEGPAFSVGKRERPGFVRVSRGKRSFEFDDGTPYYPVGANVCWAGARGTFDYDEWFTAYHRAGANYARLWLSPHWSTFALERPGRATQGVPGLGIGRFDLANAWRLDYVLRAAEQRGLYLMLCIDSYNVLREKDAHPEWERTPHNAANGGPLRRPADFWTDPAMDRLYRNKLRYLVALCGDSPHLLSWEFWNEVDGTTGYRTAPVRDWHARMARALRALDPYDHLITTSFASTEGDPEIDRLPEIDYVQTHHYNSPDLARTLAEVHARKTAYGKPHVVGEIGADASGPRAADDPEGLQVHDPIWVTLATGCAGAAQPWWWDNLIHPRNLYGLFTPAARFVKAIGSPGGMKPLTAQVDWQTRPDPLPRGDVALEGGPVSWSPSEFNRPRTLQVDRTGVRGPLPLAGIQHGTTNHPEWHNPVTLETDLPWAMRLEVDVGDVSGYGGAALRISVDGRPVLEKEFADTDADTKTLKQYAGTYGAEVPAGKHRVVVENPGKDWFMSGLRLRNAVEKAGPPLVVWASGGRGRAIAWVRLEDRTWRRVCALKTPVPPAPPSELVISGVAGGEWDIELWDTWSGKVTHLRAVSSPGSGKVRVKLPVIEKDLAVRLTLRGSGGGPVSAPFGGRK